jgi:hypothetical protein
MSRQRNRTTALALLVLPALAFATACDDGTPVEAPADEPVLLSVVPQGGASGVDPNAPVTVEFSHAMQPGMEEFADVHQGNVEGPLVPGSWSWSEDFMTLTFTPSKPFEPATTYVIHIGGGMQGQNGHHVDFQEHGFGMGGEWMTQEMHQGGHHGYGTGHGGMHGGMGGGFTMGEGWTHPGNGTYGMIFTFTTA